MVLQRKTVVVAERILETVDVSSHLGMFLLALAWESEMGIPLLKEIAEDTLEGRRFLDGKPSLERVCLLALHKDVRGFHFLLVPNRKESEKSKNINQ